MTPEPVCECGHTRKWHAIPEEHNLGTSHCTQLACPCKQWRESATPAVEEKPVKKRAKKGGTE